MLLKEHNDEQVNVAPMTTTYDNEQVIDDAAGAGDDIFSELFRSKLISILKD